ncbi:hypothetical protein [Nostoc commune]|uniref:hypothetical protein n=1 Tax=Nostoc commune TaxID=1178 RepID=UPI002073471F|nr:hypothetical protein [Nostoc commune]
MQVPYILIAVPAEDSFLSVVTNHCLNMPPHHLTRWSDSSLRNLAMNVGLSVEELWHEPVRNDHRSWYKKVLAKHYINRLIFRKPGIMDKNLFIKAAWILLKLPLLTKFCARQSEALSPSMQHGHTVVLICRR